MRLIAENLGGERGGRTVFSGIDMSLSDGGALLITGSNGAGKSTLLKVIFGLLPCTLGTIRLEEGGELFPTVGSAAHYLGHLNAMKTALSVIENLAFWRDFDGGDGLELHSALEAVGLGAIGHLPFGYLSTGQRRRASIARLLISQRPIWLLDEPTAGLDAESEQQFSALMERHLAGGGLIVAATHLPLRLADTRELRLGERAYA
ncbi:MAG: heme ABC exporter ATP-binding protein CcmA [Mesorhizobium sp.]|nr:heme ABC exporter ATP-binding protein CcmA [Mesorhizobium sp.]MBL8577651.1 heme ABC exporter ATP-binding protein CcmA [Mesorhizobium sp.]